MTGLYNYGAGYSIEGTTANLSGNELPNSPHWTTSVGAQYTWDFSGGWSATLRGDYYHQASSTLASTTPPTTSWSRGTTPTSP
jgi:outer membrane receptor protein involved in Fe transport